MSLGSETLETGDRKVLYVAPGQGGIGVDDWKDSLKLLDESPKTEETFATVKKATGVDIIELCERGEPLTDTSEVQPAQVGIGVARADVLRSHGIDPDYVIGQSLGEFTVAVIVGSMTLHDAAQTVQYRGAAQHQEAGGTGGAVIVVHEFKALRTRKARKMINKEMAKLKGSHLSGLNAPDLSTFSFLHEDKDELIKALRLVPGVKRILDVKNLNFPPHGPAVEEAQRKLGSFLGETREHAIEFRDAAVPIIAIRTAKPMKKARTVRNELTWQTTSLTNLVGCIEYAEKRGVKDIYDLGPGVSMTKMLGGFVLDEDVIVHTVGDYTVPGERKAA